MFKRDALRFFVFIALSHLSFCVAAKEYAFSFMRAQGTQIVDSKGNPIFLRGISFGNRVWVNDRIPTKHHNQQDYKRVADLGMNLVRFYINYRTLEADDTPYTYLNDGWQWLDDNIEWARQNGIYLILNMHVPQGGFQSHGKGNDLWEKPELQKRLVSMWKAIAERYAHEPVVLGYDLLNEPGVPKKRDQWHELARHLVDEIRKVDKKHPIIIERVNSIKRKWVNDKEMNFFKVDDDNVIYTFHTYDPYFYTHQRVFWDNYMKNRDGGVWPDKKRNHTKQYLAEVIDSYLAWGHKHNVPMYLGEWGVYKANFEEGRGGLNYIRDMLEVIEERKLTNTFHVYHEESFGLYLGDEELDPKKFNKPLRDLFLEHYTHSDTSQD